LRLGLVFVGCTVSSASGKLPGGTSSLFELEYPESELELLDPVLPASWIPPGGAGFTSPELEDDEEEEDPAGCSPGYGNCCAGLFGAC
jgi:hypothetical protein